MPVARQLRSGAGDPGYNWLTGPGSKDGVPLRLAFCLSHCRRRLHEIHDSSGSEIAAVSLRRIAELSWPISGTLTVKRYGSLKDVAPVLVTSILVAVE